MANLRLSPLQTSVATALLPLTSIATLFMVSSSPRLMSVVILFIWALACLGSVAINREGLISLPSFFLLLLGIYHLALVVPVALWNVEGSIVSTDWVNESVHVNKALAICGLAFTFFAAGQAVAWLFGYFFRKPGQRRTAPRRSKSRAAAEPSPERTAVPNNPVNREDRALSWTGWVLFVSGIGLGLYWVLSARAAGIRYSESYDIRQTTDTRMLTAALVLIPPGITAIAASRRTSWAITLLILGMASAPVIVFGIRGTFVTSFIFYILLWCMRRPEYRLRIFSFAALAGLMVVPAISLLRAGGSKEDRVAQFSVWNIALEPGYAFRALLVTVEEVDAGEQLRLGDTYLEAWGRALPNLGEWQEKGVSDELRAPGHWVTLVINPWKFERGVGEGFSGIAEPYLNFGTAGVILYFGALGFLLFFLNQLLRGSPFRTAMVGCVFVPLLWTIRNDFGNFTRPFAWSVALIIVVRFVMAQIRIGSSKTSQS